MTDEKDDLIKAQNEVIGVLFEIIKRFQTNNDLTDEYLELSIKEKTEIDNERLKSITKERNENAKIIARLLEKLETYNYSPQLHESSSEIIRNFVFCSCFVC